MMREWYLRAGDGVGIEHLMVLTKSDRLMEFPGPGPGSLVIWWRLGWVGGSANSSHKCGIIMIRIWAKVMAENVLLSSPRWADKQMPDPGLALRQEAKIRPATAPGDLLLSRRILGAKKWSQEACTLNQAGCLFPFPPMQSSFCDKFTLCLFSTIK